MGSWALWKLEHARALRLGLHDRIIFHTLAERSSEILFSHLDGKGRPTAANHSGVLTHVVNYFLSCSLNCKYAYV